MRARAFLGFAVLAGTVMVACGSVPAPANTASEPGSTSTPPAAAAPASLNSAPAATPTPTQQAEPLKYVYTFTQTEAGGYTFAGELDLGPVEPFKQGLSQGQLMAGSACTINSQTDAVVPGHLSVTNTTPGFAAQAAVGLGPQGEDGYWDPISAFEVGYSNGPACDDSNQSEGLTLQSTNELEPQQSIDADFFIVISNYYSPSYPQGDAALLKGTYVTLGYSHVTGASTPISISTAAVTGPGGTQIAGVVGVFDIPISAN